MVAPLCDWWLEDRSKCQEPGVIEAEDEHGAPLYYCRKHWSRIDQQPHHQAVTWRRAKARS